MDAAAQAAENEERHAIRYVSNATAVATALTVEKYEESSSSLLAMLYQLVQHGLQRTVNCPPLYMLGMHM